MIEVNADVYFFMIVTDNPIYIHIAYSVNVT